jgi:L-aspartate oxidase
MTNLTEHFMKHSSSNATKAALHYTLDYPEQLSEAHDTILLPPTYVD